MRNRILVLVLSLIAWMVALGIAPQTCKADPITFSYADNADSFQLSVTGGPINGFSALPLALGANWHVAIAIVENTLIGIDSLVIAGAAVHIVGPHGEGQNNNAEAVVFNVLAGPLLNGINEFSLSNIVAHEDHFDVFHAVLTFTVENNDITGYTFTWDGVHTAEIPEPATLLLLGTGLAGVGAAARRRHKIPKGKAG